MSNKNVLPLKIKIKTNDNKTPFVLKYTNIYNPTPGEMPRRIIISEYPYFTASVKYDEKLLASKTYQELLNIFFDKQEFIKVILKDTTKLIEPSKLSDTSQETSLTKTQMEIANANIMSMLKLIFPTSYPTINNINTSYKKYFLKKSPTANFDISEIKNMITFEKMTSSGKHNYSYIKTENGIYTISEVIWINDVINNELYRELIDKLISYNDWRKEQTKILEQDIKAATEQLQNGLTTLDEKNGTGALVINKIEQEELASQKRIYNPDDIKSDMINIIKKYVKIDKNKEAIFNENLENMADYFIDTYLKNSQITPITQFVRFKDKFNFEYETPNGKDNLLFLHKRYNGQNWEDKIKTYDVKIADNKNKLRSLNDTRNETKFLILGISHIKQYLNILQYLRNKLINQTEDRQVKLDTYTINDNIKDPDLNNQITNINRLLDTSPNSIKLGSYVMKFNVFKTPILNLNSNIPLSRDNINSNTAKTNIENHIENIIKEQKLIETKITELKTENTKITNEIKEIKENKSKDTFVFEEEEDVNPKDTIDNIKKINNQTITKMQEEIFKYVITRYNRFQEIKRSSELTGSYVEIDTYIDVIIDEIDKLNALAKSPEKTVDQILNITEPIKSAFDKVIATNKISISRVISNKLANIIKLSNKIKFLHEFQKIFFKDQPTGIFVEYEKTLDENDSFTKLSFEELKLEKYSNLKKMIDFIKEKFIKNKVVSLNETLEKLLQDYFGNKNNDFFDQVVEPANRLLNLGEKLDFNDLKKIWNVSVTFVKAAPDGPEYNVSVYMDVIEGEVNSQNQSEIKCQYKDEELTQRFEELTDDGPIYGPGVNAKVFSVKKAKEDIIRQKKKKSDKITKALNKRDKNTKSTPSKTGGKCYTKSFKSKYHKLNKTVKLSYS